jgi:hypothetical protein
VFSPISCQRSMKQIVQKLINLKFDNDQNLPYHWKADCFDSIDYYSFHLDGFKTKNKTRFKGSFFLKMEVCVKNRKKMNVCPNDFSQIDAFIVPPKVHKSIHSCFKLLEKPPVNKTMSIHETVFNYWNSYFHSVKEVDKWYKIYWIQRTYPTVASSTWFGRRKHILKSITTREGNPPFVFSRECRQTVYQFTMLARVKEDILQI